jgi:hypothetical protein
MFVTMLPTVASVAVEQHRDGLCWALEATYRCCRSSSRSSTRGEGGLAIDLGIEGRAGRHIETQYYSTAEQ